MHTKVVIHDTIQSTKVISSELTTCINESFVFHSTLEPGSDIHDKLSNGNDVTFKTIKPDQIITFSTDTPFLNSCKDDFRAYLFL